MTLKAPYKIQIKTSKPKKLDILSHIKMLDLSNPKPLPVHQETLKETYKKWQGTRFLLTSIASKCSISHMRINLKTIYSMKVPQVAVKTTICLRE